VSRFLGSRGFLGNRGVILPNGDKSIVGFPVEVLLPKSEGGANVSLEHASMLKVVSFTEPLNGALGRQIFCDYSLVRLSILS
jgi:hypothetical protein